jgi:hypothetical protein
MLLASHVFGVVMFLGCAIALALGWFPVST